ncbi:hypothetical protein C8J57DRAFT_1509621 [Mycena rebaudengoi]|nr:hypothetical protein C8J57DRAFT_1509621 [Mycena rebaudengoi]
MKFSTALFALIPLIAALPHDLRSTTGNVELVARVQGNVFACSQAGFVNVPPAICRVLHGASNQCVNVPPELNDAISSIGPDSGQDCFFFQ